MSDPPLTTDVSSVLHLGHAAMRDLVAALPVSALDWKPGPGTNSIAALVVHALDAERHLTGVVADLALPRDREAAFRVEGLTGVELVTQIDAAERDVDGHLALVTGDRLAANIERPSRTATGAGWLVFVAAHSREHIGQASLTRQLAEQAGVDRLIG
jgi:DinB superfamily